LSSENGTVLHVLAFKKKITVKDEAHKGQGEVEN